MIQTLFFFFLSFQIGFPYVAVVRKIFECHIFHVFVCDSGTAVAQWLRRCAINWRVAGSIPAGVSGFFVDIKSFQSHYGPGGRLSL